MLIQDYDDVMERGFSTILFSPALKNGIQERSVEDFLYYHFEHKQVWSKAWRPFYAKTGIPILIGARAEHPLDLLQSYRGINQLVMDMYTVPDKLIEFMEWLADYEVMQACPGVDHHGRRRACRERRTSSSTTVGRPECPRASTTSSTSPSPRR